MPRLFAPQLRVLRAWTFLWLAIIALILVAWGAPVHAQTRVQLRNAGNTGPTGVPGDTVHVACDTGCAAGGSIVADTTPFLNMTTATTTKIVTGTAAKKTYITHLRFMANGTTTAKLVSGTGTNCATGTADLTETWDLTAQVGEAFGGAGPVIIAPTAQDVCAVNGQAVNLRIGLAETQQ